MTLFSLIRIKQVYIITTRSKPHFAFIMPAPIMSQSSRTTSHNPKMNGRQNTKLKNL